MKFEWKKHARSLYLPKAEPEVVTVPSFPFFMLSGKGNPNGEPFAEAVGVLYALSYGLKMLPKKGIVPEGYYDYTVFPLEGVWDLAEEARGQDKLDKDSLIYTLMIRQPDYATTELAEVVIASTKKSKPHPLLEKATFGTIEDGMCVQMLHLGSYDDEPASFASMEHFCDGNQLKRKSMLHREIYITDARKTAPDKLKTVLRFQVES